jgi:3-oxoacyl-[acyl-carrier-protein] synthase II
MYILSSSSICFQPTFRNVGFSKKLITLNNSSTIQQPDYTICLQAIDKRRMSDGMKMAIACSRDCLEQANVEQPSAIIVGTSSGCAAQSKTFLDNIYAANGGPLSPTAFILSTHNSIAGQISVLLKNHHYNITHTHNSLSFEHSLIDAKMHAQNGKENILVGAAEELELELYSFENRLNICNAPLTFGTSFFLLSPTRPNTKQIIKLIDIASIAIINNYKNAILEFLNTNHCLVSEIDLVLFANNQEQIIIDLESLFDKKILQNYQLLSGQYYTNSAFAMHLATDILYTQDEPNIKTILICNNMLSTNLGLQLIKLL